MSTHIVRTALAAALAAALLAFTLGAAQAQVAIPDLVPAAPRFLHPQAHGLNSTNIAPDNPAALAWGTPSRVGAGVLEGEVLDDTDTTVLEHDGTFAGLRLVGETFGFAAETLEVEVAGPEVGGVAPVGLTLEDASEAQLSVAFGQWLALGVGAGSRETELEGGIEFDRVKAGASLRLGEIFYLGAGVLTDDLTVPPGVEPVERDGTLLGIAMRTEGNWNWLLSYDVIDLEPLDLRSITGNPDDNEGLKLSTATVQLLAGSFLLGVSAGDIALDRPANTASTSGDITTRTVDLGYAPMEGLNVSARWQELVAEDPSGDQSVETASVALAWAF